MTTNEQKKEQNKLKWFKSRNRFKFRIATFLLMAGTIIIAGILAWHGKDQNFGSVVIAVGTFAGIVFGADYATKPFENHSDNPYI